MTYARIVADAVAAYPYTLRPAAKATHPEVWPLPATWEQCTPEQLAALEAVPVVATAPPALDPGETVTEGTPALVDGEWRQTWVVHPAQVPAEVDALALELVLESQGLLAPVLAYVEAQSATIQSYWRRVRTMRRNSPLIEAARIELGLTTQQVDGLFVAASAVEV